MRLLFDSTDLPERDMIDSTLIIKHPYSYRLHAQRLSTCLSSEHIVSSNFMTTYLPTYLPTHPSHGLADVLLVDRLDVGIAAVCLHCSARSCSRLLLVGALYQYRILARTVAPHLASDGFRHLYFHHT